MKSYSGDVIRGTGRATALGFPTLNIKLGDAHLSGIYAGTVECNAIVYSAALYADQERGILESHLLEPAPRVDATIIVTPLKKIREKKNFKTKKELEEAIQEDIQNIKDFFVTLRGSVL